MKITSVHHIAVINSNYEKSYDFYVNRLGLKLEKVHEFPTDGTNHMVIVLRKIAPTPAKYPRRYAKIKAAPL